MKRYIFIALVLLSDIIMLHAQPQKMTYQSVVRNSNNELVVNQQVGVRVSILEDSVNGPMIYRETHTPTTNVNGLITIMIGEGLHPYTNTLDDVNWDRHTHYLSVEIDPAGGTNYTIFGAQQLVSVPYAFYSESARYVDTAIYAVNATVATYADTSRISNFADTTRVADYAHNSGNAVTANYATSAGTATTATSALYADSTRISNHAITSTTANMANYADSSDYNHLVNRPLGNNTGDILYWNTKDSSWHVLPVGNSGETLVLDTNNVPKWNAPTIVTLPTVTTDSVINVTSDGATAVGTMSSNGGSVFVFSGICWSTFHNPTTADNHTIDGSSVGSFISKLSALVAGTNYYVRAFATNSAGTNYGNEVVFTTTALPPTVTTSSVGGITGTGAIS